MDNILVTGGAGFIGSNFIRYMLHKYGNSINIINVDCLTYAGNLENLKDIQDCSNYKFFKIDIKNYNVLKKIFSIYNINKVINFAAESHVDRSIEDPKVFITTNILGTQILLDVAKKSWNANPDNKYSREYKCNVKFLQVSTDEVYGSLGKYGKFTENNPLCPNSPYSASKAGADMLVMSYYKTFGMPINITRCSNNYGPYQFPEKLIPLMINNCLKNKQLPIYGDGLQVRDWLYVDDHCSAIDVVLNKGICGDVYNIGGNNEKSNIEIVKLIIRELDKSNDLISFIKDRPGHDRRYAIDNNKISLELGWKPQYKFEDGMKKTIRWYLNNNDWIESAASGEYKLYYNKMYEDKNI